MTACGDDSLFLTVGDSGTSGSSGGLSFVRAAIPLRVGALFRSCNQSTIKELALSGSDLDNAAGELSGARALLAAVMELGIPYTLQRDAVLHGFLYGSEPLTDTCAATNFLNAQNAPLRATPNAPPRALADEAALRFQCFTNRLSQCLTNLQATGQPEIPRLVGHTLRLLNLLSDACTQPTNSPPPTLEMRRENNSPCLLLYGEPYVNYTLQSCGSLSSSNWTNTAITACQDGQTNSLPSSGNSQSFYRAVTDLPSSQ